jgi:hypothetical protein
MSKIDPKMPKRGRSEERVSAPDGKPSARRHEATSEYAQDARRITKEPAGNDRRRAESARRERSGL